LLCRLLVEGQKAWEEVFASVGWEMVWEKYKSGYVKIMHSLTLKKTYILPYYIGYSNQPKQTSLCIFYTW